MTQCAAGYPLSMRNGLLAAAAATAAMLLTGCSSGHEPDVESAASRYFDALASDDGQAACDLLAADTRSELEQSTKEPCAKAIVSEAVAQPGERKDVQVFGTMAEVRYSDDTVFLTQAHEGWRVMASACKPVPAHPYDCSVKGG